MSLFNNKKAKGIYISAEEIQMVLSNLEFTMRDIEKRKLAAFKDIDFDFFSSTSLGGLGLAFNELSFDTFCCSITLAYASFFKDVYKHIAFH